MKKVLLLSLLVVACNNIYAFTTQGDWRWRKDDGSETAATWLADENTEIEISNTGENLRLRVNLLYIVGGLLDGAVFEYSTDTINWIEIKNTATTEAFVLAGSSPYVTDLEATTKQLAGEGLDFYPGKIIVSSEKLPQYSLGRDEETEFEYCIKPTANIQPATTYYFRVNAAEYFPDLPFPSLKTAATLPIQLSDFSVKPDGKQVKIQWSTSFEQNNDRFEIERSTDAKNWKTVATVKGSGTTSIKHTYSAVDQLPVRGLNYYRIKQYDLDGKSTASEFRSLKMFMENVNSAVSVFPNPAKSTINFMLHNFAGKNVVATLINNSGRVVHTETIKDIQSDVRYTLQTRQQPAPGVYVLQLKGEGLTESIKVIVQ